MTRNAKNRSLTSLDPRNKPIRPSPRQDRPVSKPATAQVAAKNQTIQKFKSRAIEDIEMRPIPDIHVLRSHAPTALEPSSPVKPGKAW